MRIASAAGAGAGGGGRGAGFPASGPAGAGGVEDAGAPGGAEGIGGGPGPGDGHGWYFVAKAIPGGTASEARLPGVGGEGPGGGQGGAGGMGAGEGGGIGSGVGPGLGPIGPIAEGAGPEQSLREGLLRAIPEAMVAALSGAPGVGSGPGAGRGVGAGWLPDKSTPGGGGAVHAGVGGLPGAVAAGVTGSVGGTLPGAGGPVGMGLPAFGGAGGAGLLPLPGSGPLRLASADGLAPGLDDAGFDEGVQDVKGTAGGGLYVGVRGSFDMPLGVTTGDYQADAPGMLNLLEEVRGRTNIHVTVAERYLPLTLENIRRLPVLHLRGHRAFSFSDEEREVLRKYVAQGGTIFGEDSHGPFGECFRREMKKTFGEDMDELPVTHELYRAHYVLDRIPAGDMGERYPLQGIETGDRLGVIFSRNDYGDCWEGTGEWVREESREPAFQMGVNIFTYIVAKWQEERKQQASTPGATTPERP